MFQNYSITVWQFFLILIGGGLFLIIIKNRSEILDMIFRKEIYSSLNEDCENDTTLFGLYIQDKMSITFVNEKFKLHEIINIKTIGELKNILLNSYSGSFILPLINFKDFLVDASLDINTSMLHSMFMINDIENIVEKIDNKSKINISIFIKNTEGYKEINIDDKNKIKITYLKPELIDDDAYLLITVDQNLE